MSASERLEAKKGNIGNQINKEAQSWKEALNTLTGYADHLLTSDEYKIYEDTFEKIKYRTEQFNLPIAR